MKQGGGVHTVYHAPKPWCNKVDGRVRSRHPTREEAVEAGREIARQMRVEHTIHNADGEIGEKNSYGNDPNPPKG